jgi:predicted transcriptional regulator
MVSAASPWQALPEARTAKHDQAARPSHRVRQLPEDDQDTLAIALLSMAEAGGSVPALNDETRAAIRDGLEQARRGEFVPKEEIEALWKRHGL